jgi:hypothetical protein
MIPTSTTNCYTSSNYNSILTSRFLRKVSRAFLLISILSFSSVMAKAQHSVDWNETRNVPSAASRFATNFNYSNGTLRVESYAYNGCWWREASCCCYGAWIETATLSYTTNGTDWVPYFRFGNDRETWTENVALNGASVTSGSRSTEQGDQLRYFDLQVKTPNTDIKKIRIKGKMKMVHIFGVSYYDDFEDFKEVDITQMSSINTPTYNFLTALNNGIYEPRARLTHSKASFNEVDNQSNLILYDGSISPNPRITGYLP